MALQKVGSIYASNGKKTKGSGLNDFIAIPIIVLGVYLLDKFLNG